MPSLTPALVAGETQVQGGGKRGGVSVKKLKTVLKKAGLKTSGKKATLRRRVKKAHLKLRGGADVDPEVKDQVAGAVEDMKEEVDETVGGRRRSRRSHRGRKHTRRY
jgi:hypothetical protein